jgi:DNA repair protein SbcD/Mre11
MFKFLHAADLHLDSPLVGLDRREGAPSSELRGATRRALENLVELAIEEQVAFVLLAGDLYDGSWKDYNTGIFFVRQMARLGERGIRVFVVSGNHDAENQMTRALQPPRNVVRFSTQRAETHRMDEIGVAIHGRGYPSRELGKDFVSSYPPAASGCFNVGLLHTSLTGREGHVEYAPCSLDDLRAKHYQYWALGHVHRREIVSEDPWIVFPGNIQGRHVRETGPKGCTVVTVNGQRVTDLREAPLGVIWWSHCVVDVSGVGTPEAAIERVVARLRAEIDAAEGRLVAARVEIRGSTAAHAELKGRPDQWEAELRARAGDAVWLEKIAIGTTAEREGEAGAFADLLVERDEDRELVEALARDLTSLRAKLPGELLEQPDAPDPTATNVLEQALRDARDLLRGRLGGLP